MTRPSIQIEFDSIDFFETLRLAEKVASHVDILGVGNSCLKHNGIQIVQALRRRFPDHKISVDLKTVNLSEAESNPFYAAGASICTVMGIAAPEVIEAFVKSAGIHGALAQVDLLNVQDKTTCATLAAELGAQLISCQSQLNGDNAFADLRTLAELDIHSNLSVSGKIDSRTTQQAAAAGASIIAIDSSVFCTNSATDTASAIRDSISLAVA